MKLYLFVASADQVVYYVGGGGVAAGTAEPLAASQASDNGTWVVNTTVSDIRSKVSRHSLAL